MDRQGWRTGEKKESGQPAAFSPLTAKNPTTVDHVSLVLRLIRLRSHQARQQALSCTATMLVALNLPLKFCSSSDYLGGRIAAGMQPAWSVARFRPARATC